MDKTFGSESSYRWTSEEIQERIGMSTIAFPGTASLGAREIAAIREMEITRIEICGIYPPSHYDYHNRTQVSEIMAECRRQGVSIVSMHGPSLPYNSKDEDERKAAVKEAVVAAKVTEEMGATVFVGHFGIDEQSEKTVTEMLEHLDGSPVKLTVENGADLRDYMAFVDKIGSDRCGMIVDIGHTRDADGVNPFIKKERARQTMAQCGKRLFHLQLHDFTDTDHIAPFHVDGKIQWGEVFAAFKDIDYKGEFMFEAKNPTLEEVLQKTAAFPKTFVQRYGRP